jgi:acyl-CoA synthetase (AMP-forming)/AMP-acid ligase II
MAFMARHPIVTKFDLSSLRVVFSGAAPLDAETQGELQKRLPKARIAQGYGMTETSPVTHVPLPDKVIPGSVGLPVPNTSCRIVSIETGHDLPPGPDNSGELWIKGPQVMKGYLNNAKATHETMAPGGWLRTGDIAWRDEEGNTYIKDRLKDFIKVKGFQVAPAELEGLLISHPALADAGVTSMKDERSGELPVAFVVKKQLPPGAPAPATPLPEVTESSIKAWLEPKVAEYKMPAAVVFVDAIPKAATGKILRRVLKEQVPAAMEARKAAAANKA